MNYIQAEYEAEYFIGNAFSDAWEAHHCTCRPDNYNDLLKDFEDEFGNVWSDLKSSLIKALSEQIVGEESEDVNHFKHLIVEAFRMAAIDELQFEAEAEA